MIRLYGLSLSNYYNKVKLALLEKGLPFDEVKARPSQDSEVLAKSPMGKIPWIESNGLVLAESQPIVEWLEETQPAVPLYPADPAARGRVRELVQLLELYCVTPCGPWAWHWFFGAPLRDENRDEQRAQIDRGLAAFDRLARCGPWLAGEAFGLADIAGVVHLPWLREAYQGICGADPLLPYPRLTVWLELASARPHAARVLGDRAAMLAMLRERQG